MISHFPTIIRTASHLHLLQKMGQRPQFFLGPAIRSLRKLDQQRFLKSIFSFEPFGRNIVDRNLVEITVVYGVCVPVSLARKTPATIFRRDIIETPVIFPSRISYRVGCRRRILVPSISSLKQNSKSELSTKATAFLQAKTIQTVVIQS